MKVTERRKKLSQQERVGSMICKHCGSYAYDSDYKCLNCGNPVSPSTTPEAPADPAQPTASESGKGTTLEVKPSSVNVSDPYPQLGLVTCLECGQRSLFWNRHDCVYRCVNPECKRAFRLEEYREKEMRRLPEEQQTEQVLANESITEAANKTESGATEQIPCNESIANESIEPSVTKQMPSKELPVEATDKMEVGATEQMLSNDFTTAASDKIEPNATEQIPSNVSAAEVKDEIARAKIEESPSAVPTTEARDEVEDGTKSAKKINHNLAFLLISVLAMGIVVLGVFLSQKSGDFDELSAQLNKSTQALAEFQTQLAAHQQDIKGLMTQVTQAQQEIEALQAEMNQTKPLTPSEPFIYSGELSVGDLISIPIELKQSEEVRGTITGGISGLAFSIQDSGGGIVKDLGLIFRASFIFKAQTSGSYNIVIKGPNELTSKYNLEYTIYRRQ